MEEPEPVVVRAAMAGDIDAFEHLVRSYQEPVWRFLCRFVGDEALAQDLAQETFLRCHRNLHRFGFQAKFSTWLFQIARNAAVDAHRARGRRERLLAVAPVGPPPSAPEASVELRAALASLTPKLREAIVVVEVLGVSYREAATVLGVPEGTVKSRVFQARERLTAWFEAEDRVDEV